MDDDDESKGDENGFGSRERTRDVMEVMTNGPKRSGGY